MSDKGGTHSGEYEPDTAQEPAMEPKTTTPQQPLIEPGLGESEEGLFFEPAKTVARVKAVLGSIFSLLGALGITFVAGDAEVLTALEAVASLGIGLVAAVLVAWNALSQGTRTREAVFSPASVQRTKGQRE